jgi:hypothetical protein
MLDEIIKQVKRSKAEKAFDDSVRVYGSLQSCLRSFDCKDRDEAIRMLTTVQSVRVYKVCGRIVVE